MTTSTPLAAVLRRHAFLPILAGSLIAYSAALAQSTGSQTVEAVVVTGKRQASTGGLAVQVRAAKDQSIVTQDFIKTQIGSSNFAQAINLLPGVTYSTEDPTGLLSGDLRIHGFDGAHVSVTADGTPLNDTGNYAIFPGEYVVAEAIDHITVNQGQTEVDSPTASAIGGTINIVTKVPSVTPEATVKLTGGSYDFGRGYGEYDTGAIGPFGTRAFAGVNYAYGDKYKGAGELTRWGVDGRVYQPLSGDDFVSVAFTYASERNDFYESDTRAQFAKFGRNIDFNTQWAIPSVTPGAADVVGPTAGSGSTPPSKPAVNQPSAPGFEQGNDSFYWRLHPNPVDFGDLRGQSRFTLPYNVIATIDPYLFYTLANGGGASALSETDPRLIGSGAASCVGAKGARGVDLNRDGDCLDSVLVYSPNNTQTARYGVNTSLIWDFNPQNRFQLAYSYDYGHHRQTGQYTTIDQQTGVPNNIFGGKEGYGVNINALDGAILRGRDRLSLAILNQVSLNYIGRFLDDRLHVNLGLRDPYFERDLNQYCYTLNGASQVCDSIAPSAVQNAFNLDVAAHKPGGKDAASTSATNLTTLLGQTVAFNTATGQPNFRFPFKQTYNFNRLLPNVGVSYDIDDHDQVYATFAQGFSAPKTDDLYTSSQELVRPESTNNYGVGYRYHGPSVTLSVNGWASKWYNHIVQSTDPNDASLSIDRNVGSVELYGIDVEGAWRINEQWSVYGSTDFTHAVLLGNYNVAFTGGPDKGKAFALPVKGKELVMQPVDAFAARVEYKPADSVTLGLDAKYTGKRFTSDTNDNQIGGFTVVDFDAEYRFTVLGSRSAVAFNVYNLFDQHYFSRVSTIGNAKAIVRPNGDTVSAPNGGAGPFIYIGAPTTAYITLKTQF